MNEKAPNLKSRNLLARSAIAALAAVSFAACSSEKAAEPNINAQAQAAADQLAGRIVSKCTHTDTISCNATNLDKSNSNGLFDTVNISEATTSKLKGSYGEYFLTTGAAPDGTFNNDVPFVQILTQAGLVDNKTVMYVLSMNKDAATGAWAINNSITAADGTVVINQYDTSKLSGGGDLLPIDEASFDELVAQANAIIDGFEIAAPIDLVQAVQS